MNEKKRASEDNDFPLRILLVGNREEDFFIIRDLLSRIDSTARAQLDHADSAGSACLLSAASTYDLVLFEHDTDNATALRLVQEMRSANTNAPFIFLAEHTDEATLAGAIAASACNCVARSELSGSCLARPIRCAFHIRNKEHKRLQVEDTLRKLSRAVEQSADLVIITDRAGIIEYVNPAFETLTGYTREESIGRNPRFLKSGQQSSAMYRELWSTILSGKVFRGTLANRKKNGEIFYAEKTVTPVRNGHGEITHFISNDRDITEQTKLEAQLRQAQKMDAIGQLAGGIAHDFNNLLMVISSYAELTLDATGDQERVRHHVEAIAKAAGRAAELTRQLLAFSRKQMQTLQIVDLNKVAEDVGRILPRLIGEDIRLSVFPGKDLRRVRTDPVQIEQVLMNLATNARDAMPRGGTLTIELSNVSLDEDYVQRHPMVPSGNYVLLEVADSGCGIAPEHLPHIFEPFFTTKQTDHGTGLGLATVYGIVKQNGGFIWVYSEPGLGTTFKIYLPQIQQADTAATKSERTDLPLKGYETVLLVEDDDGVRQSSAEFLRTLGYKVLDAKDGPQAIELTAGCPEPIHVMVTDVVMPRMSGGELAHRLAQDRPSMKLIFVSGYAERTILEHGVISLTNNFLQKPFALKELARKIREVLQSTAAASAAAGS